MASSPMRISLRGRLLIGFGLSSLVALLVAVSGWNLLESNRRAAERTELAARLVQLGLECRLAARSSAPGQTMQFPAELTEKLILAREQYEQVSPRARGARRQQESAWEVLSRSLDDLAAAVPRRRDGGPAAAADLRLFEVAAESVEQQAASLHEKLLETGKRQSKSAGLTLIVLALLGIVLAQLLAMLVTRSIVAPLERCYASALSLCPADAAGESDFVVGDELGQLNALINSAADSIQAKLSVMEDENGRLRARLEDAQLERPPSW